MDLESSVPDRIKQPVDRYLDDLIGKIAAAQEADGYLYTARTIDPEPHAIVRSLRYRDAVNNLAATQRNSSLVRLGNGQGVVEGRPGDEIDRSGDG